jgi:peptidoglycan/LPS O-acetylase OafA/YrhL
MSQERCMHNTLRPALGALTGARFLAALWVVVYHYFFEFQSPARTATEVIPGTSIMNPFLLVLWQGHLAVDFFFLLSGFILAYTYLTADTSVRGGSRAFWVARVARIYPVYLLGLLLGLGQYLASEHSLFGIGTSTVANLLLLQAWFPPTLGWNQPSWSLSVEAFFYLLFPFLLPLMARLDRRGLWRASAGAWAAFAVIIFVLYVLGLRFGTQWWWWGPFVRYNPFVSLPEFVVGMALGLLFVRSKRASATSSTLSLLRWSDRRLDRAIALVAALFLALLLLASAVGYTTGELDSMAVYALPFFAALIGLLAFGRGVVARALAHPRMLWLGEISYGVYIVHWPVWWLLSLLAVSALHLPASNPLLFVAYLAAVLLVAGASFVYLERPARRFIRARWAPPKVISTPA